MTGPRGPPGPACHTPDDGKPSALLPAVPSVSRCKPRDAGQIGSLRFPARAEATCTTGSANADSCCYGRGPTSATRSPLLPQFLIEELRAHVDRREPNDLVSPASATVHPCGSAPSACSSASRPRPSASPTCTPSATPNRRQPRDRVRGGREGRPADARSHLRHMTLDTSGHLLEDRLEEVGDALDRVRTAARERRESLDALPHVARELPEPDLERNTPPSVSAGHGPFMSVSPTGFEPALPP